MDLRVIYQLPYKNSNVRLFAALTLFSIFCISNTLDFSRDFQFEIDKIELADCELDNDNDEQEKMKESEKEIVSVSTFSLITVYSRIAPHLNRIEYSKKYYINTPNPPPDYT